MTLSRQQAYLVDRLHFPDHSYIRYRLPATKDTGGVGCGCELCLIRGWMWSAFCLQWVGVAWAMLVGRE